MEVAWQSPSSGTALSQPKSDTTQSPVKARSDLAPTRHLRSLRLRVSSPAMLISRPDGFLVDNLSPMRRMMPYILPSRNESCVYFEQKLDLREALPYLGELNTRQGRSRADEVNLFHLILAAAARVFRERPELNRFVSGGKIYQRRHIELSFALKKQRSDKGALTTTKLRFSGEDSVSDVADRTRSAVTQGRSNKPSQADHELAILTRLPGPLLRLILWLQRGLDAWNLLPSALIVPDPLYASLFFANLGSIGLDSAYHHLFEYGSVSFFAVLGRIAQLPFVIDGEGTIETRPGISIKYTFDERITDGFYCARSLDLLKDYIEHPVRLEAALTRTQDVAHSAQ